MKIMVIDLIHMVPIVLVGVYSIWKKDVTSIVFFALGMLLGISWITFAIRTRSRFQTVFENKIGDKK